MTSIIANSSATRVGGLYSASELPITQIAVSVVQRANEDAIMPYVRQHATEMNDSVMRAHIELYVNDLSDDLGDSGIAAVHALFERAHAAGLIDRSAEPQFV